MLNTVRAAWEFPLTVVLQGVLNFFFKQGNKEQNCDPVHIFSQNITQKKFNIKINRRSSLLYTVPRFGLDI